MHSKRTRKGSTNGTTRRFVVATAVAVLMAVALLPGSGLGASGAAASRAQAGIRAGLARAIHARFGAATLRASSAASTAGDPYLGTAVAVSADGTTALVGAPGVGGGRGAAYIFHAADAGSWTSRYVIASDDSSKTCTTLSSRTWSTCFSGGQWQPHLLDIGANIGCTAILFGEIAHVVHALQPSPTTFGLLRRNVERAGRQRGVAQRRPRRDPRAVYADLRAVEPSRRVRVGPDPSYTRPRSENIDIGAWTTSCLRSTAAGGFHQDRRRRLRGPRAPGRPPLAASRPLVVLELNHWR